MYQYIPYLERSGFRIDVHPLLDDDYLRARYEGAPVRKATMVGQLARRFLDAIRPREYDLIWLEKELIPWLPGGIESVLLSTGPPVAVDYDDATFHVYDAHHRRLVRQFYGGKIDRVMRKSSVVICGNAYLLERARLAGAQQAALVPTSVDLSRYPLGKHRNGGDLFTIGWIGTPMTSKYLQDILPAIAESTDNGNGRVLAIGARKSEFSSPLVETIDWSEDSEVENLCVCDVGIMPLRNTLWEKGKCGLKLIQFMACGIPVVASPVGVNSMLVQDGTNGYSAGSDEEWVKSLRALRSDPALRNSMGRAGRALVEEYYSLEVTAPMIASLLHDAARRG